MALQWYRWDSAAGRMVWKESDQRPGPEWESSDVPLFDSNLVRPELRSAEETWTAEGTWTVLEDSPLDLERSTATGLFQALPEGQMPAFEYREARPAASYRSRGYEVPVRLVTETLRTYPPSAEPPRMVLDWWSERMTPPPRSSPRVRAWWQRVHRRRSSASRVPLGLPRLSGLRLAGHRPLTSGRRR